MFLTRRPSPDEIKQFLDRSKSLALSYDQIGIARETPHGFKVDEARAVIGYGEATFSRAKHALTRWNHFDLGWVELHPQDAPIAVGAVVAVLVRHLGFWSLNGCRIVYLLDDHEREKRFGFAYGTLTNHAESGEEIFEVRLNPESQEVIYRIRAVSRPRAALAVLGYPYTRLCQDRFRQDSIAALQKAALHKKNSRSHPASAG
jgi:uncharacterized protein (UPF0548 family)